jgi:nicotinamidase-related amidase
MERLMAKLLLRKFRRVLIDVNTQYDLIFQGDNDNSELLRNIRRLFAWARVNHIPVISTALICRALSCPEAFKNSKPLCLEGTAGQKKLRYSMLTANVTFGPDNRLDLPRHILSDYQQVIFEIRSDDPFSLPRADRLLSELRSDKFIVFGSGIESGIKHTVLELMRRRKKVTIVEDAISRHGCVDFEMGLRKLEIKGAVRANTADLAGVSRLNGHAGNRQPWRSPMVVNARIG